MSGEGRPRYTVEFKLSAVHRLLGGTNVSALARELGVKRKRLYAWRDAFRSGGEAGMRGPGRPRKSVLAADPSAACDRRPSVEASPVAPELEAARARLAVLERKVGQQQLELDFFRRALRQVKETRRPSDGPGVAASTPSSRR